MRIGATIKISRKDGRKMAIVDVREPQKPSRREPRTCAATRYPTKVAVMTTGPGLIIPIATATRNSRSLSQLPNVSEPALRKKVRSLPSIEPRLPEATLEATSGTPKRNDEVVDAVFR